MSDEHYCPKSRTLCPYGGKCPECQSPGTPQSGSTETEALGTPRPQTPAQDAADEAFTAGAKWGRRMSNPLVLPCLWALIDHVKTHATKLPKMLAEKFEAAEAELQEVAPREPETPAV